MKFREKNGTREYFLPKLKQIFNQKRTEDDEFARDYASHEFNIWKDTYFVQISEVNGRALLFPTYAGRYNDLRRDLLRSITTIFAEMDMDIRPLQNMNCDELLQELSMHEEDLKLLKNGQPTN